MPYSARPGTAFDVTKQMLVHCASNQYALGVAYPTFASGAISRGDMLRARERTESYRKRKLSTELTPFQKGLFRGALLTGIALFYFPYFFTP